MNEYFVSAEWLELEQKVPDRFKNLCIECYNYTKLREYIIALLPSVNGNEISIIQKKIQTIVEEYLNIMRDTLQIELDEKKLKGLANDIKSILSSFYEAGSDKDKEKKLMDLSQKFHVYKQQGSEEVSIPLFLATFDSFITSRIYYSLLNTYKRQSEIFIMQFCRDSIGKAGIIELKLEKSEAGEEDEIEGMEIIKKKK